MNAVVYIALGSNLGDRRATIDQAVARLAQTPGLAVVQRSSLYETAPVGGPAWQGRYLNAVVEATSTLAPEEILDRLHAIEADLGRVRDQRDGPRTIDLDLLFFNSDRCDTPRLVLPHPRLHERLFVLDPLAEIAPGVVHPRIGLTIAEIRSRLLGIKAVDPPRGRELQGLRALVTGSTSGIGRAIALELASGGADVIVHGRRSREAAHELSYAIQRRGGMSSVIMADLADPAGCDELRDRAWEMADGLDIVVNNAGADTLTGEAARYSFEQKLEALWAVDVRATLRLSRELGRRMKKAGSGVILTMGWDQAETGMEGDSGELFATVKAAVMGFTRSLALSLAPEVRVHCLAPGWIRTAWGNQASEAWQERVRKETPLDCWGEPEDVARTARWLVSPQAKYLTGQVIRINGGAVR